MRPLRFMPLWTGLWCLAVIAVVVLSLITPPQVSVSAPSGADKIAHALAYFLLTFSALQLIASRVMMLVVALLLIGLGLGMEVAQGSLRPDVRMFDWWDGLANAVGVIVGVLPMSSRWETLLLRAETRFFPA